MHSQETRKGAPITVAQVDNVPVVELSVDRLVIGEYATQRVRLWPEFGRAQLCPAPLQALVIGSTPSPAFLVDDPFARAVSATLADEVAGWGAVQTHSTLQSLAN